MARVTVIHELLMALVGHVGGIFDYSEHDNTIECTATADLGAQERAALSRVASLGMHFSRISQYISYHRSSRSSSAYARASAQALNAVLASYRAAVLWIEQEAINCPSDMPSLLHIEQSLAPFNDALPDVAGVLERAPAGGADLLWHIHTQALSTGSPATRQVLMQALGACNHELLSMVHSWLVFGVLIDTADEFFIRSEAFASTAMHAPTDGTPEASGGSTSDASLISSTSRSRSKHRSQIGSAMQQQHKLHDDGDIVQRQRSMHTLSATQQQRTRRKSSTLWRKQQRQNARDFQHHRIATASIPPRLELDTANAILFSGQALRILKQTEQASRLGDVAGEVVQGKLEDTLDGLVEPSQCELDTHLLRRAVEPVRDALAQKLWSVVVERHSLDSKLNSMRDYMLSGRGDFTLGFLEEARNLLLLPPTAQWSSMSAQLALENAFTQAGLKSGAVNDQYFACFLPRLLDGEDEEASVLGGATNYAVPRLDGWDAMVLECDIEHPLSLVLNEQSLQKYQALHRYIMRLKRVEQAMHEAWTLLQQYRSRSNGAVPSSQVVVSMQMARHEMAFFVRNWLAYLLCDVVEPEHTALIQKLRVSHDFRELTAAHEHFLDSVISKALLDTNVVVQEMEAIMQCSMKLYAIVRASAVSSKSNEHRRRSSNQRETEEASVKAAWFDFRQNAEQMLSKLRSEPRGHYVKEPSLASFLIRIGFTDFFADTTRR